MINRKTDKISTGGSAGCRLFCVRGWLASARRSIRPAFSFVEMAMAILILGMAFTMTLKGTAMIDTFKALLTTIQIDQLSSTISFYAEDDRHYLPGDDPEATEWPGRERSVTRAFGRVDDFMADGKINGRFTDAANVNGEQFDMWRDLRYAGLLGGSPALVGTSALPENYFGGVIGIHEDALGLGFALCFTQVPGRAAQMMDEFLDDGVVDTGSVRSSSTFATDDNFIDPPPADDSPYDLEKAYVLCTVYPP